MHTPTRIAVLGLYNSGSTALAGVLHRLSVHMGPPFWRNSDDHSPENYYEPCDLSCQLRAWWDEPHLREQADPTTRIAYLANWIQRRQQRHQGPIGIKQPLLSLCGEDILQAWGSDTIFFWAWRPLAESIARLRARKWFPNREEHAQRCLWQAVEGFCAKQPHCQVEYHRWKSETAAVIQEIATYAYLRPTDSQMAAAIAFIDQSR
jgi:hypothetical protein